MITVTLLQVKTGHSKEFGLDHAENLLNLEAKLRVKLWTLPDNSPYTFTNGKLIRTTSDQANQGAGKPEGTKKGSRKKITP